MEKEAFLMEGFFFSRSFVFADSMVPKTVVFDTAIYLNSKVNLKLGRPTGKLSSVTKLTGKDRANA